MCVRFVSLSAVPVYFQSYFLTDYKAALASTKKGKTQHFLSRPRHTTEIMNRVNEDFFSNLQFVREKNMSRLILTMLCFLFQVRVR